MRPVHSVTICLLLLLLSACGLRVKQAKTPPPPQPAAAKAEPPPAPPAPAEPLSTPQTQVRLPPPQPIDPDAVVAPPVYVADASQRGNRGKKPGAQRPPASQAKPEPVETADAPQPPPDGAPGRLEPVIPEGQRVQRIEEISARLQQVDQTLARVQPHNDAQKRIYQQIRNFAAQAHLAEEQGDIQKASGLVERARLLLQDLARAR